MTCQVTLITDRAPWAQVMEWELSQGVRREGEEEGEAEREERDERDGDGESKGEGRRRESTHATSGDCCDSKSLSA